METAEKLIEIMGSNNLDSPTDAIGYAADEARDRETLSDAELAHLLYRRLSE